MDDINYDKYKKIDSTEYGKIISMLDDKKNNDNIFYKNNDNIIIIDNLNKLMPNDIIEGNYKNPNDTTGTVKFKAKVLEVNGQYIVGELIESVFETYIHTTVKDISIDKSTYEVTSTSEGIRTHIALVDLIRKGNTGSGGGKRSDIQKRSRKTRKSRKFKKQKGHNRRTRR